jgi:hypothetical protein
VSWTSASSSAVLTPRSSDDSAAIVAYTAPRSCKVYGRIEPAPASAMARATGGGAGDEGFVLY